MSSPSPFNIPLYLILCPSSISLPPLKIYHCRYSFFTFTLLRLRTSPSLSFFPQLPLPPPIPSTIQEILLLLTYFSHRLFHFSYYVCHIFNLYFVIHPMLYTLLYSSPPDAPSSLSGGLGSSNTSINTRTIWGNATSLI